MEYLGYGLGGFGIFLVVFAIVISILYLILPFLILDIRRVQKQTDHKLSDIHEAMISMNKRLGMLVDAEIVKKRERENRK